MCDVIEMECPQSNVRGEVEMDRLVQYVQIIGLVEGRRNLDREILEARERPLEDPGEATGVPVEFWSQVF